MARNADIRSRQWLVSDCVLFMEGRRRQSVALALSALLVAVCGGTIAVNGAPAHAAADPGTPRDVTVRFDHDSSFTVPDGVSTVSVTVVGAGGGTGGAGNDPAFDGRAGNEVTANVDVTALPSRTLQVVVGEAGGAAVDRGGAGGRGFGDGGAGGVDSSPASSGGGGGGGSAMSVNGSPIVVAGGGGGGQSPTFVSVGDCISGAGETCPTVPASAVPTLPEECTVPVAATGHDGVDGGDSGSDGDYSHSTGGGGGGGWVGGAGGWPTSWSATTSEGFQFVTCTGYGLSGTNHVDDAVATLVSAVAAEDAGQDGWVTIAYDDPPDSSGATTTTLSSTTAVDSGSTTTSADPTAVAARPVVRGPRYTG